MSNGFSGAQRVAMWTQPDAAGPPPFVAWGAALREAFSAPEPDMVIPVPAPLDIEVVRAEAMAQGFAAGIDAGRREADGEREALRRLAAGLEALQTEPTAGLGMMIAATVERLLHQVVGEVEVCRETLIDRAQAAAALIGDETRPALLKLNPADLARIEAADLPLPAEADATLAPGELRLETALGSIEDGPGLRLERLRAALDKIAVQR